MDEQTFSGSLLFSVAALLNWLTKSSKIEEGFNKNELLFLFFLLQGMKLQEKETHKILKHTGNVFRRNLQLKNAC